MLNNAVNVGSHKVTSCTSDGFRCFPGSTDAVNYRGEIHETDTANVFDLIIHIEEWTAEGVSILVQRVFIEVDSSCRVAFNEEECLTQSTANSVSVAIIGGTAAGGVVVIKLIGIITVTMVILVLKHCKDSYSFQETRNR